MVVAIFRSRVRAEHAGEYERRADEMAAIARAMPGFISRKAYNADDGERESVHERDTTAAPAAWRNHPEHVRMQSLGRDRYCESYTLYVCDAPRQSVFNRPESPAGSPG